MTRTKSIQALTVLAVMSFGGAAQAQYVTYAQPAPLYPYAVQPQYVYPQPQYAPQPYPYVQSPYVRHVPPQYQPPRQHAAPRASQPRRKVSKTDPALVEELRRGRHEKKKSHARKKEKEEVVAIDDDKNVEIDKKIVVREKPVVRKHVRVVEEPPIVVEREIDEHGRVLGEGRAQYPRGGDLDHGRDHGRDHGGGGRVIHAEAEVTILGPDRMNIKLTRKSDGRDANAEVLPAKTKKKTTSRRNKAEPQS
jgi:hypothetical protein